MFIPYPPEMSDLLGGFSPGNNARKEERKNWVSHACRLSSDIRPIERTYFEQINLQHHDKTWAHRGTQHAPTYKQLIHSLHSYFLKYQPSTPPGIVTDSERTLWTCRILRSLLSGNARYASELLLEIEFVLTRMHQV